jgi:ribonuclease HII
MAASPSLRVERALLRSGAMQVCGMDEVGRGALSGPVTVGVVVVDARSRSLKGVRDSKLLAPQAREELVPAIRHWAVDWAVGHASAAEIDEAGIIAGLRLAGLRALGSLRTSPDVVLLDGSHDWLSAPAQGSLFDVGDPDTGSVRPSGLPSGVRVHMRVKADLTCTSVAAASVLAKVERDALMRELHAGCPHYGWTDNKGYASPDHLDALRRLGPSSQHRRSWRLPGVDPS